MELLVLTAGDGITCTDRRRSYL